MHFLGNNVFSLLSSRTHPSVLLSLSILELTPVHHLACPNRSYACLSDAFSELQTEHRKLNTKISMLIATLKACAHSRHLHRGKQAYKHVVDVGLQHNIIVANTVVDMFAKCGSMVDARRAFDSMQTRDVISWTSLINGYVDNGEAELGFKLFSCMEPDGCQPDGPSYIAALRACTALAAKETGRQINGRLVKVRSLANATAVHFQVDTAGCMDLFLASTFLNLYSKCGSLSHACWMFERMPEHDVPSCNALILGYAENGAEGLALDLFERVPWPNSRTFLAVLKACSSLAERENGQPVNGRLVKLEALEKGMSAHSRAKLTGCDSNTFVLNNLVDMYAKCASLEDSRRVFDAMETRCIISWNSLILGYADNGEGESAINIYVNMRMQGFSPDVRTYSAVLKACGALVALGLGKAVQGEVCRYGLEDDIGLDSCIVDFLGRCGGMVEARTAFDSIVASDSVTWTALIAGYSRQGDSHNVLVMFERMKEEDRIVDGVTLLCVLAACSHAGLDSRANKLFSSMQPEFGVTPGIEHCHCLVDLLCRRNKLDEAVEMVKSMPFQPNTVTWRIVLSGSRNWRNPDVGRLAFESLVALDDQDAAGYVMLLGLYGSLQMWEEHRAVERMRREAGTVKKLGRSWWTDRLGMVHGFVGGEESHPQSEEINAKLRELGCVRMEGGESDEGLMCGHSERLALACALINTPPGMNVRIMKNLRVCESCHRVLAGASQLEQREIVCRDVSRLHVFKDGRCSCGDYW